jgi:hypothetical protein
MVLPGLGEENRDHRNDGHVDEQDQPYSKMQAPIDINVGTTREQRLQLIDTLHLVV